MKIKNLLSSVLFILLISVNTFAGSIFGGKDPLEVTYIKNNKAKPDPVYQQQLRKSIAWQKFLKAHGEWYVQFNEANQRPHRAYGNPISVSGSNAVEAAENFITGNLQDWNFSFENMKFQSQNATGKYYNVFYKQTYHNLEVLNSRVFVKLTKDFKVNTWGMDVFDISISTSPAFDETAAIAHAKNGITNPVTGTTLPELKILPIPDGHTIVAHLVYEIIVSTINEEKVPSKYYTLVDANSGEILYRHDNVNFARPLNSTVNVESSVHEFQPYVLPVVRPLRNLKIDVGANTYYTDSVGEVAITGINPINATFSLEGLWSQVVTDQDNFSPVFSQSLSSGANTAGFDSITSIRHISGYFHVNNIHDFMKIYFPSFNDMDFPLPTRIDVVGGSCNAYYTGSDINFFETGGGCNCMSQVADIVYHEYGHGINDLFYQAQGGNFNNGAMHEGYADVWAFSLTKDPVLGKGYSNLNHNAFIRRYDVNKKVYPANLTGESHADGEIIAGAWYDVSLNLNSWSQMTDLFAKTFFELITGPNGDEGQIYTDILLAALNEDDNDGNLTNGTPNDLAIVNGFDLHGITLLSNSEVTHNPVLSSTSSQDIVIDATLTKQYAWAPSGLIIHYRTNNFVTYTTVPMTFVSGNQYTGVIPHQPAGAIISYYIQQVGAATVTVQTLPAEADISDYNIPYYIIVGCIRDRIEDFDGNQSPGWLTGIAGDDATGGLWTINTPVASFSGFDTCQAGVQHTPGGTECAVTGNAASTSSQLGSADVDNGHTTLQSPDFDLTGIQDPIISYWRWFSNDQGQQPRSDYWKTYISDGHSYVQVEYIKAPDHSWRRFAFRVRDYIPNATHVTFRFVADDTDPGSNVEVALDDIEIYGTDPNSGISSPLNISNFNIYPNPASTSISIDMNLDKSENISFEVVNNLGEKVLVTEPKTQTGKSKTILDISQLKEGIYYLVVNGSMSRMGKAFSVVGNYLK